MRLLKIKLFFEIGALRSWIILLHKIPLEILHATRSYGLREIPTFTVINASEVRNDTHVVQTLQKQIIQLFGVVHTTNGYFWPALLDPDSHMPEMLLARPEAPYPGHHSPKPGEHGTDEED